VQLAALIGDMNSEWFGANLDIGHSHVLGEDPEMVMDLLGTRVFHIHLEDILSRKHYHLIPGLGDVDFKAIFNILKKHAYRGFITVELYTYPHTPEEAVERALKHLRGILSSIREE
jgi:sugar phosphate isomerase/epimerase